MPTEKEKDNYPKILRESDHRTLFVDNLTISTRQDGMHLIQFYASLPNGWSEQVRLMVSDQSLGNMLRVLTERCASWPVDERSVKTTQDSESKDEQL